MLDVLGGLDAGAFKPTAVVGTRMDLKKLDPMARKMRTHVDGFYKALEEQDTVSARDHINEVLKFADYLGRDIDSSIVKANDRRIGVNDIYAGGVPVRKMTSEVHNVHAPTENILPGTVRTSRVGMVNRRISNRTI